MNLVSNPWSIIDATKKSPLALVLAVVFVIHPIVSLVFGFIGDVTFLKQELDPTLRPVTVAELNLINQKIDSLEAMIEQDRKTDEKILAKSAEHPNIKSFKQAQSTLDDLQKKLDKDFKLKKN